MENLKDKKIELLEEIHRYLFIEYGDRFMDDIRYNNRVSELNSLNSQIAEQGEVTDPPEIICFCVYCNKRRENKVINKPYRDENNTINPF